VARPIVFLSDYGLQDEYVGVCHGVIARIAPDASVLDLTHAVPAHDVARGAVILAGSVRFMPEGAVFLAVVDPGVGLERRAVAVQTGSGAVLVGPDNGLLSLAWDELGGPIRAFSITSHAVLLSPVSHTFHGRDVFAPAAAHVARGLALGELGPEVSVDALVRISFPQPTVEPDRLQAVVLATDRFGNLQLAARLLDLESAGLSGLERLEVTAGDQVILARPIRTFGELRPTEAGITVDSSGFMALVVNGDSAALAFGLGPGDDVQLARPA
jgi:S-adenosyl-L-methionine hydrolase (adenosine-forming)